MLPLAQAPAHPYGSPFFALPPFPTPSPFVGLFLRVEGSHVSDRRRVRGVPSSLCPFSSFFPPLFCCSFAVWICCASILFPPYSSLAACAGALCSSVDSPWFPCLCLLLSLHTNKGSPREHDAMGGRQLEIASWSPAGFNAGSK